MVQTLVGSMMITTTYSSSSGDSPTYAVGENPLSNMRPQRNRKNATFVSGNLACHDSSLSECTETVATWCPVVLALFFEATA